mmetsp:Transcript_74063/g.228906  ORF Transcript_74063/g.228906 Transcript_74063/m.228906 type:complete len:216 (-) Transcript_74063:761-1408(-)
MSPPAAAPRARLRAAEARSRGSADSSGGAADSAPEARSIGARSAARRGCANSTPPTAPTSASKRESSAVAARNACCHSPAQSSQSLLQLEFTGRTSRRLSARKASADPSSPTRQQRRPTRRKQVRAAWDSPSPLGRRARRAPNAAARPGLTCLAASSGLLPGGASASCARSATKCTASVGSAAAGGGGPSAPVAAVAAAPALRRLPRARRWPARR